MYKSENYIILAFAQNYLEWCITDCFQIINYNHKLFCMRTEETMDWPPIYIWMDIFIILFKYQKKISNKIILFLKKKLNMYSFKYVLSVMYCIIRIK